jgi:hypothetical protein
VDVGCLLEKQWNYAAIHSQDDAYQAVDDEGCSNPKEQYMDVIQLLLQWLYASGLAAGFNPWKWNMCMKHLGDMAVHQRVGTLMERFEREASPGHFDMSEWSAFMHTMTREVQQLEQENISSPSAGGIIPCMGKSSGNCHKDISRLPNLMEVFRYLSKGK